MNNLALKFCFKGSRTYIHGTDIYNTVINLLRKEFAGNTGIDLTFHNIANHNLNLTFSKPLDEKDLKFAIKYSDHNQEKQILYYLIKRN